mgnify:CR=1 FL=1
MGLLASSPSQFVAATKAKSSEVNSKFTDVYNALAAGTHDHYVNAIINNRISNGSVDVTSNACYFNGYHTIDTTATYKLKTSSSRMVIFGALTINTGGILEMTSGSEALIV